MGKVATIFKLMPDSVEVDIDKVVEQVKSKVDVTDIKIEPIAFGLKAIKVMVVTQDGEGGTEDIEKTLSDIEGVAEATLESATLV